MFGPFRLDLRRRLFFRDGSPVPLRSRAVDILCALVAAAGNLVSKDELMAQVWPHLTVGENTLQVHVSALRKALGEDTGGQRHIVTVAGRGYRFIADASGPGLPMLVAPEMDLAPPLPDKLSIAVMPFDNTSDDAGQGYFADGIAEDITTALSRMRWLFVIARNSSFTYKGRSIDVKLVGRELGVRYILGGSVRRARNRVRITGRLADAARRNELWADRFDGGLEDVFGLQDMVASSVVSAIAPRLQEAEIERAKRKPTESLNAYDYYLRGMASMYQWTREGNDEALRLFYKAIDLDPAYACAHGLAALCLALRKMNGWTSDLRREGGGCTPSRAGRATGPK
jgi:TolB-like protein